MELSSRIFEAADLEAAVEAWKATTKPMAMLWIGKCNDQPDFNQLTIAATGMPVFRNTLSCVKAVQAAIRYGKFSAANAKRAEPARPAGCNVEAARALVKKAAGTMTERASKEVLAAYGFPVTRETLAKSADEAVRIAADIGSAVAMKIESADIPHKTEARAVRLGLDSDAAVTAAFDEILQNARAFNKNARIEGVLVQEMVQGGVEFIVGVTYDRQLGPMLLVGTGGVMVEVYKDTSLRRCPITSEEAREMIAEVRGSKLLAGFRGAPAGDVDALAHVLVRVSHMAVQLDGQLAELDINPVLVRPKGRGVTAVDALLVLK